MGTSLLGFIPTRLHCGGKSFRKAFRIFAFDWRKSWWVVEQDFMGIFGSTLHVFSFALFSGLLHWTMLILLWFERSFPHTQVRWQSFLSPLKLMTSQAIEGAWIRTGGLEANGLMGHLFFFVFFFVFFCFWPRWQGISYFKQTILLSCYQTRKIL